MSSWPSHSPGPSSVPKWLLHHFLVITILLSVASTKDLCDIPSDFGNLIHTIGVIDNELWAIANDKNWTVYKLVPYKMHSNGTLDDSMIVSPGIPLETKWPQLGEAIKNASGKTDFDFTVDNSVIMDSVAFGSTVLAMKYSSPKPKVDFGYNFGTKQSTSSTSIQTIEGSFISTGEKDKAYTIDNSGKKIQSVEMKNDNELVCSVKVNKPSMNICNLGSTDQPEVQIKDLIADCKHMNWTVLKGVLYHSQYYFFASGQVNIFSDQANNAPTKLLTVSYEDFLQCKQPTTMAPSTSTSVRNVTSAPVTKDFSKAITDGNKTMTSTKASNTTLILILVGISIVILVGVAIVVYCFCFKKNKDKVVPGPESALSCKQPQSKATSFAGASKLTSKAASQASPKDSKRAAPKQSRSQLNKKVAELKQKEKESDKDSYAAFLNMKIKSLDGFDLTPAKVPAAQPVASKNK